MRTDELRSVLSQHGDEVHDIGVHARTDAVRRRVRGVRRRRTALVSGGVATAVAAVALAVVPGDGGTSSVGIAGGTSSPGPASAASGRPSTAKDQKAPSESWSSVYGYTKDGLNFPMEVSGEALMAAEIGDPGEARIVVDVVVPDGGLRWIPVCYGVDGDYFVHVAIDDHLLSGVSCRPDQPHEPARSGITFDGDPTAPLRAWGLQPGDMTTARVWLSHADGPDRAVARDPGAVVGIALYEDPWDDPALAESLPDKLEHEGRAWTLDRVVESSAGDPVLDDRIGRPGQPVLLVVGVDRLRGGSAYTVSVDGTQVARAGNTGVAGPTWEPVTVVDAGTRADVRIEHEGPVGEVRFVLAEYRPAR